MEVKFQEISKELASDPLNIDRLIFSELFHQKPDLTDRNYFN